MENYSGDNPFAALFGLVLLLVLMALHCSQQEQEGYRPPVEVPEP